MIAALVLSLGCWQAWAQHGGGHGGGGHASGGGFGGHSSFGGDHVGGFSGGHSFGGLRSYGGSHSFSGSRSFSGARSYGAARSGSSYARSYAPRSSVSLGAYARGLRNQAALRNQARLHSNFRARNRSFAFGSFGFRSCWGCWGWGYGWGYPYLYGGIDPYWWWDNDSDSGYGYGDGYEPESDSYNSGAYNAGPQYGSGQYGSGPYANANDLYEQQDVPWRPDSDPGGDSNGHRAPAARHDDGNEAVPATILVFRDQHKQEVDNYAIIGQTVWMFSPDKTQKVPLSDLDIPATQKANDDRGVTFRVPGAGEGQ